jgi:rhodanese-related sulfurtransferase
MSGAVSSPARPYGGDVAPQAAWKALSADKTALLVDVRTQAEWTYVGVPDLTAIGRAPLFLEYQTFPEMQVRPGFGQIAAAVVRAAGARPDTAIFMLCRSGARSRAAAVALSAEGFARVYNVSEGFEGEADENGHRGRAKGWKAAGLPWSQS